MSTPGLTPSQTVGPFFHDALLRRDAVVATVVPMDTAGSRVRIHGTMIEVTKAGIETRLMVNVKDKVLDAFYEIWRMSVCR